MIYFVVGVSLLLGSPSLRADGLQINGAQCGIPTRGMIVNGSTAATNEFPWAVYLEVNDRSGEAFECGGSILTKRHILTAAHCLYPIFEKAVRIYAYYGNSDWERAKILPVTNMVPHPQYSHGRRANDIAVLTVERPFQFGSNVRPICIPEAPINIMDTDTIVAGWGRLKEGGDSTNHLQYTTVRVLPNEMCSAVYNWQYDSDVMYCAYRRGTDSCHGDSGGPAISLVGDRYVQVGIVSFGYGCARENISGVYTRVEAFTSWIKQEVGSLDNAYSSAVPLQLASYTVPPSPPIFQFL